jgi:phosphatidylglycerophosphate synthase
MTERRPLASRDIRIIQTAAAWLGSHEISANAISLASIGFAALASLCLVGTARTDGLEARALFVLAAGFVQLRLLANLLDGMVAVGSGSASPAGELYNEVPDRVADTMILIGAGFAAGGAPVLGYAAALLAVFVAYTRALGSSLGAKALFIGPMAKPQRMATITAACLYSACVPADWLGGVSGGVFGAMSIALALIVAGAVLTAVRRLRRIAAQIGVKR